MSSTMLNTLPLNVAPKKVLVVARSLQGIAHWIVSLREAGCWVELARTPAEAIVQAAALNPEVVVIEDPGGELDSVALSLQIRSRVSGDLPPTFIMAVNSPNGDSTAPPASLGQPHATDVDPQSRRAAPERVNRIADLVAHRPPPPAIKAAERLTCQGIHLDRTRHRAWVKDRPLRLTPTEFKLLWELASRPGDVLPRSELTKHCRSANGNVQARTVDAHVKSIRRKMQEMSNRIETVHGVGYRFQESEAATF